MPECGENRRLWRQRRLADTLAGGVRIPGSKKRMFVLIARPDDLWTPQYRAAVEQRRESLARLNGYNRRHAHAAAARRGGAAQLLALSDEGRRWPRGR